jgi:hypothetical protein
MTEWEDFFCILPRWLDGGGIAFMKTIQRRRAVGTCSDEVGSFDCYWWVYRKKPQ